MADVFGVNQTIINAGGKISSALGYGRRRTINEEFTANADVLGTDIVLGNLTVGTVIQGQTSVTHAALGASTTLNFAVRDNRTGAVTAVSAPADTSASGVLRLDLFADITTIPFTVSGDSDSTLLLQIAGGTATGLIKVAVEMTVD